MLLPRYAIEEAEPVTYSKKSKRLIQAVTSLGSSIAPFMVGAITVAAPTIGEEFGANVELLSWLTAGFFLVAAAFLIPFGRVADIKGSRRVFTAGMVVYVLSTLVSALAPDILIVILGRAIMGVGAAMVFGTSLAILSLVFPDEERPRAIGINITAMFVGFTVGLMSGGFLSYYLSWRGIFLMATATAALALVLILSHVRAECELARTKDYDPVGMALYSASIVLVFYGLSQIDELLGALVLVLGAAGMATFLHWEKRYPSPLIPRRVARSLDFRIASVTNVVYWCGSFSVSFLISLHLQYVSGLDARISGFVLLVPQSLMLILGPFNGRIVRRLTHRIVAGLGAGVNALGLVPLLFLSQGLPVEALVLSLVVIGVGTALFMAAVVGWAMGAAAREEYGLASSFTETMRLAGMTLSNTVLIIIFSMVLGGSPVGPENLEGFLEAVRLCIATFLALSLGGTMSAFYAHHRSIRGGPDGVSPP